MTTWLDRAAVERFRGDVARLLPRPVAPDDRLALAVSGGPDSMAMLALAAAAYPGQVVAATVDHGLRAESRDEARMVGRYAGTLRVEHATLTIAAPPGVGANLQAWARQERYHLLRRWSVGMGAASLATAHHADDQAETFLMRATRGAGLSGLAGIRAAQEQHITIDAAPFGPDGSVATQDALLALIRPLLRWRRAVLRQLAVAAAVPFVDDPSNADSRFDRARIRDVLRATPLLDPAGIARSAAHLAEVEADLLAVTRWLWAARADTSTPPDVSIDVADLPRGVRRHIARDAIAHVMRMRGETWDRAGNIESLLDALEVGTSATQAGVMASARGTLWHFRTAPPRRPL